MGDEQQRREALRRANAVRQVRAAVKRGLRDDSLSVGEALTIPGAGGMTLGALLGCQCYWGASRVHRVCVDAGVEERRQVGDLHTWERAAVSAACEYDTEVRAASRRSRAAA